MALSASSPLILRTWRQADAPALLEAFAAADMAHQASTIHTPADAARWLQWASACTDRASGFCLAVTGPDDEAIGHVAVTNIDRHATGWASYWTTSAARGRQVASHALAYLASWVHDEHGVARIELGHRVNNPASCRVALSAGFLGEGIERGRLCYDGARYDVERHARLDTDPRPNPGRSVTFALP